MRLGGGPSPSPPTRLLIGQPSTCGALAAYGARAGMEVFVFMPQHAPVINQMEVYLADGGDREFGRSGRARLLPSLRPPARQEPRPSPLALPATAQSVIAALHHDGHGAHARSGSRPVFWGPAKPILSSMTCYRNLLTRIAHRGTNSISSILNWRRPLAGWDRWRLPAAAGDRFAAASAAFCSCRNPVFCFSAHPERHGSADRYPRLLFFPAPPSP